MTVRCHWRRKWSLHSQKSRPDALSFSTPRLGYVRLSSAVLGCSTDRNFSTLFAGTNTYTLLNNNVNKWWTEKRDLFWNHRVFIELVEKICARLSVFTRVKFLGNERGNLFLGISIPSFLRRPWEENKNINEIKILRSLNCSEYLLRERERERDSSILRISIRDEYIIYLRDISSF